MKAKNIKPVFWTGQHTCDFCQSKCGDVLYDAKTIYEAWATMCEECFHKYGTGSLGVGFGQKYHKQASGVYVKVERLMMDIIFFWKIIGTFAVFLAFLDPFNSILKSIGDDRSINANFIRLATFVIWSACVTTLTYFIWWFK